MSSNSSNKLRAAFMGSPDFAVPSLHATARACDLRVVVSQPDRPKGRGRKVARPAVAEAAQPYGVPILQPKKVRDGTLHAALAEHELDLIVVAAYGRILPMPILELPKYGCINVHGSLLPRWRGAAPIQRAVLAGDAATGIAIMQMAEGCDTGAVFRMVETPIGEYETSGELFERLSSMGGEVLEAFLNDFPNVPAAVEQDHDAHTHAPKLEKAEGALDFDASATDVINHVRGMDPWPGAFTARNGATFKVFAARRSEMPSSDAPPGTVLAADADGLHVQVRGDVVRFVDVQPAGKRRMAATDYVKGQPFADGEVLRYSAEG